MVSTTQDDGDQGTLFHPDILEPIFRHVSLIDLVPACHVSKSWSLSVHSSLRYLNKPKPWLLIHTQDIWSSTGSCATHAYDPRSHVWMDLGKSQPSVLKKTSSPLRSSNSNLLCVITPTRFSYSLDPLHATWRHGPAPSSWRDDPIVAAVGSKIVLAGGVCDFEDDHMAVEVYDADFATWRSCRSMPESLSDSAASWLLSVATDGQQLYVVKKRSGVAHVYNPDTDTWSGSYCLWPELSIFFSVIAYCDDQLLLIGILGEGERVQHVKLWRVDPRQSFTCQFMGEMPMNYVEKLKRESYPLTSIAVCFAGNMMYIYNPSEVEEMIACEVVDEGVKWHSLRSAVQGRSTGERVVCTCSEVSLRDIEDAMRMGKRAITVKDA